ncbi:MAG TPA: FCD domain-containing protein [Acidimicrobiales bacterium]|nr:FCD domain-containing protein [Acidimicrobiales bacterium]
MPTKKHAEGAEKLAEGLAREIEQEIIDLGWPVGQVLGSEPALLDRFGVSRAVLREAIRLLEHHEVARMRRGPGGGLVVTEPNGQAVVRSVALLLEHKHVPSEKLFEARMAIELTAVDLAAEMITEDSIKGLRAALDGELEVIESIAPLPDPGLDRIHVLIAEAGQNEVIRLFVEVLAQLTSLHATQRYREGSTEELRRRALDAHQAHIAIIEAVVAGDRALARHRMMRHVQAMAPWIGSATGGSGGAGGGVRRRRAE